MDVALKIAQEIFHFAEPKDSFEFTKLPHEEQGKEAEGRKSVYSLAFKKMGIEYRK